MLLGLDVAGRPGELLGAFAILLAAVGYAAGPMIIKHRFRDLDPLGPVTASMGISGARARRSRRSGRRRRRCRAATRSCPSSSSASPAARSRFLLFFALINEVGPGRATVITYVNPVVAVALGVTLLGESLGPTAVAGLLLILAGSWLSTGGRLPPGLMRRLGPGRRGETAPADGTVRATA